MPVPPLRPPRAVLFDIGDTLLVERRFDLEAGIAAVVGERGEAQALARAFLAEVTAAHRRLAEPLLARWLRERVPRLASMSDAAVEDAIWPAVVTFGTRPDVEPVLARLSADGVAVAAVSNAAFSGRILRHELARHGLADGLRFVLTSGDAGCRKPAAPIFDAALARLAVDAADVWFVGDTFDADVAGALAAGMQPVWLHDGAAAASTAHVPRVRDWAELAALYARSRSSAG